MIIISGHRREAGHVFGKHLYPRVENINIYNFWNILIFDYVMLKIFWLPLITGLKLFRTQSKRFSSFLI